MKRLASPPVRLGFLVLCLLPFAAPGAEGPQSGDPFPDVVRATDQHGKERTLSQLMGPKGVALFFVRSADWCPFCMGQLVDVNRHAAEFEALGLNVVSISVDEVAEIARFAAEKNITFAMLADPKGDINLRLGIREHRYPVGSAAFGVPKPTLYIVDRSGRIRLRFMEPTFRTRPDLGKVLAATRSLGW